MEEPSPCCKLVAGGPVVELQEVEQFSSSSETALNKDVESEVTTVVVDQEQCPSSLALGKRIIDAAECVTVKETVTIKDEVRDDDVDEKKDHQSQDCQENMSKRKLKKMIKKQKWMENKKFKREKEKEKKKAKKRAMKEAGIEVSPKFKKFMDDPAASPIKVAIDLSFNHLMTEKDQMKLVKQVLWSYSANRKAEHPLQLYLTNFDDNNVQMFDDRGTGYLTWNVHYEKDTYTDTFGKENVVYLTSDSSNVLKELEANKAYIIGGLVDHNSYKGLCHKLAEEEGIAHAKLPICDYVKLASREVLTVNHVYEILLRFVESGDWQKAFYEVIPKRKGITLINVGDSNGASDSINADDSNGASDSVEENDCVEEKMDSKQLNNEACSQSEDNNANCNLDHEETNDSAVEEIDNNESGAEQVVEPSEILARASMDFDVLTGRSINIEIPCNRNPINLLEHIDIRTAGHTNIRAFEQETERNNKNS